MTARVRVWFIGFMVLLPVLACTKKDDAAIIRERIQEGAALAEAHAIGDLLDMAGEDFIAMPGRYDKRSVKGVLFVTFRHYGQFNIHYPRPVVEIGPGDSQATATIYFMIVSQSRKLPGLKDLYEDPQEWLEAASEKADLYQLTLTWVKHDGEWLVQKADIQGFQGRLF